MKNNATKRREFYIASINNNQVENDPVEEVVVEEPRQTPVLDSSEFATPMRGRQRNAVAMPPSEKRGNKGFQYDAYRKEKKFSREDLIARFGSEYFDFGAMTNEQYDEILRTGKLSPDNQRPKQGKAVRSFEEWDEVNVTSKELTIPQNELRKAIGEQYHAPIITTPVKEKEPIATKPAISAKTDYADIQLPDDEVSWEEDIKVVEEAPTKPQVSERYHSRVVQPEMVPAQPALAKEVPSKPKQTYKKAKYHFPSVNLLTKEAYVKIENNEWTQQKTQAINRTFQEFKFGGRVARCIQGPAVAQFLIEISPGTNVKDLNNLTQNLMMNLSAASLRIQAPIPGENYAGIEIPNEKRRNVSLGNLVNNPKYLDDDRKMLIPIGIDIQGQEVYADIAAMPHCLVAGATGSGKSVFVNSAIVSLLYKNTPDELRFILIDPKMVDLAQFEQIPHLAMPIINDANQASAALRWAVEEMERRFMLFKACHVRNLAGYNELMLEQNDEIMPRILIVIDELSDLMSVAASEVEGNIQRITQKARAAGIHILVATQRPSVDVLRGSIKNNILVRAAFKVSSYADSNTIIDHGGAEKLLGRGDMLYSDVDGERRIQGTYVTDFEITKIANYISENNVSPYLVDDKFFVEQDSYTGTNEGSSDPLFEQVAYYVVQNNSASANRLSQKFGMGFNRTNAILLAMEEMKIVGPAIKGRQRDVLVDEYSLEDILNNR